MTRPIRPKVNPLTVACPRCKAEIDKPCMSMRKDTHGQPTVEPHLQRADLAREIARLQIGHPERPRPGTADSPPTAKAS